MSNFSDNTTLIHDLKLLVHQFVKERDWVKYHNPKNLAMSIAVEAAELMDELQWCTSDDAPETVKKRKQEISNELADIFAYILSFAYLYDIDLSQALQEKMKHNGDKYPVERVTGTQENFRLLKQEYNSKHK